MCKSPQCVMVTPWHGNISSLIGPFVRGNHRSPVVSPHKGPVTRNFGVFFEQTVEQKVELSVIWDAMALMWRHCNGYIAAIQSTVPINNGGYCTWWGHQMETFSSLLVICAGNSPVHGEFPAQRPVTRSFDVFFICVWINGWVNNREAGDLRRYRAHYDVIVMISRYWAEFPNGPFYWHGITLIPAWISNYIHS